jgi:hypothetical protein
MTVKRIRLVFMYFNGEMALLCKVSRNEQQHDTFQIFINRAKQVKQRRDPDLEKKTQYLGLNLIFAEFSLQMLEIMAHFSMALLRGKS